MPRHPAASTNALPHALSDRFARPRAMVRGAAFGAYAAATLGLYELQRRLTAEADQQALQEGTKRRLCRDVLRLLAVDAHLEGPVPVGPGPRLIVANHRSALDIAVILSWLGGTILSRADLRTWPVLGRLAWRGGTIFVDREDRASGARAIRAMRRELKAGGSVVVFPEGTTFAGDTVRPFRAGAFVAAKGLDVELVPVGLAYAPGSEYVQSSFVEHVGAVAARSSNRVAAVVGPGFHVDASTSAVAEECQRRVQALVDVARTRV